jgi:hypothetical protein
MSKILGDQLDDQTMAILGSRIPTVIVATTSPDGYANTTPIHLVHVKDPRTVYLAMARRHQGVKNITENGKCMVNLVEGPNMAVSFKGNAHVLRDVMECSKPMCVVQVDVLEVKSDRTHVEVSTGIRHYCRTDAGEKFCSDVFDEMLQLGLERK